MPTETGVSGFEAKARSLLNARMDAIRALAQTQAAVTSARDALATAEKTHADAYTTAERAGWTTDELRKVGLDAPARRRPGRPRRSTPAAAATARSADGQPKPT